MPEPVADEPPGSATPWARLRRRAGILSGVFVAQSLVQLVAVVSGFLLLRWLDVEAFAQYSLAFGFAATLMILVDAGLGTAIAALVGERQADKVVVGTYVRAARQLRNALVLVSIPVVGVAFFVITDRYDWGLGVQLALLASVIAMVYFRGLMDYAGAPLLLHSRFTDFYRPQATANGLRLGIQAALQAVGALTAWLALAVNAAAVAYNGWAFRRRAAGLLTEPPRVDPEVRREVRRYIGPLLPSLVFVAFQSQITIFLIGIFGSTQGVAEVGALSRLGQLFVVFLTLNGILVTPFIARSRKGELRQRVALVMAGASAVSVALTALAFVLPEPLLWLLGPNYDALRTEVGWFVLASSVGFLSAVVYAVNTSRNFVWWWLNNAGLVLTLGVQAAGVVLFRIDTTLGVQYFFALTNVAMLVSNLVNLAYGLARGPRRLDPAGAEASA